MDNTTLHCHVCGTRIPLTHNHGTEDVPMCEKCLHARNHAGIEDYCYKPRPIFYGKGPRYYGVELEIDDGGELNDNANEIMSAEKANVSTSTASTTAALMTALRSSHTP